MERVKKAPYVHFLPQASYLHEYCGLAIATSETGEARKYIYTSNHYKTQSRLFLSQGKGTKCQKSALSTFSCLQPLSFMNIVKYLMLQRQTVKLVYITTLLNIIGSKDGALWIRGRLQIVKKAPYPPFLAQAHYLYEYCDSGVVTKVKSEALVYICTPKQ